MNVFLQLATFEQGKNLLSLFEFPKCLLGGNLKKERYSWIALNGRKANVDSMAKFHDKASSTKFSEIGYETVIRPVIVSPSIILKEAFGVMQIPGTSPLWAGPEYWEMSNVPSAYRRARSARRSADATKRSKVPAFPAVFELTLKFSSKLKQDELASALVEWISQSFDKDALRHLACGVADFGDSMLFSKIEMVNLNAVEHSLVHFLYRFVLGTPLLTTHIDRLHAIHIHNRKTLTKIAQRLGLSKPVPLGIDLAMISIPKKLTNDLDANLQVAKFAIPRDDSTSWAGLVRREGGSPDAR